MKNVFTQVYNWLTGNRLKYDLLTDTFDCKMIIINADDTDKLTEKKLQKLAPKWATPGNFTLKRSREATIHDNGKLINLWQINGEAVLWKRTPTYEEQLIEDAKFDEMVKRLGKVS